MSRRDVCTCEPGRFTCGHCLANAPAPVYTPSTNAERMDRAIWRCCNCGQDSRRHAPGACKVRT